MRALATSIRLAWICAGIAWLLLASAGCANDPSDVLGAMPPATMPNSGGMTRGDGRGIVGEHY